MTCTCKAKDSKMRTIQSATDVKRIFPNADIDRDGISQNDEGVFLNCDSTVEGCLVIDGNLTREQLLALAYWLTHLEEFAD